MADTIGIGERRQLSCNITNSGTAVDADVEWACDTAGILLAYPTGNPGQAVDPGKFPNALRGKQITIEGAALGGPVTLTASMTDTGTGSGASATFTVTVAAGVDVMSITSN